MKKFLCLFLLSFSVLLFSTAPVLAQAENSQTSKLSSSLALEQTIDINSKATTVTQTIRGITNESEIILPIHGQLEAQVQTAPNTKTTQDDGSLKVKTAGMKEIKISYQSNNVWREFTKDVAQIVIAKPISFTGSVSTKVLLSGDEIVNAVGAKPSEADYEDNRQFFIYEQKVGKLEPIILLKGTAVQAQLTLEKNLENNSFWWKNINTLLPLDTSMQSSFEQKISPEATSMRIDKDGNITTKNRLFPKQGYMSKTRVDLEISQNFIDRDSEAKIAQIPPEIAADYSKNTDVWPGGQLKKLGLNVDNLRDETVIKSVEIITDKVVNNGGQYNPKTDFSNRQERVKQKPTTSIDYADKTVAALRETGIPSRVIVGWKVHPDGNKTPHAWVEAYIPPDEGWLAFDPALMKSGESPFGVVLFDHIANVVWGANATEPAFNNESAWEIEYKSLKLESQTFGKSNLNSKKYMFLPGVSAIISKVDMPKGQIVDAVLLETSSGFRELGSLAPLQKFQALQFSIGSESFNSTKTTLGVGIEGEFSEVLVEGRSEVVYWSMIISFVIIFVLVWLTLKFRKRANPSEVRLYPKQKDEGHIEDEDLLDVKGTKTTIPVKKKK